MTTRMSRARTFVREKVLRRPPRPRYMDPAGDWRLLEKATRSAPPRGLIAGARESQGVWVPITRPEGLVLLTDLVWILGAGVDRVVEETTKGGWDFEARFQAKCLACGAEYDVEPELCETSGCFSVHFRDPDPEQLHGGAWRDGGILKLLERPNWDPRTDSVIRTFKDMTKDAVHYNNVIGWWNWEVVYDAVGRPAQIWSMNAESMRRVDDPNLLHTIGRWFCPVCHQDKEDLEDAFHKAGKGEESPTCPEHGILLQQPEWVQLGEGDEIVAVWAVHEVLTDMPRARGNRVYPRSKVHRTWALGQTMRWTERFDLAALSGQRSPDAMVTVEGRTQAEVNNMLDDWEDWLKDHNEYEGVIWVGLGTEAGKVEILHFMGDLINRDFIAWGEAAMKAVAINLGVSFVFVGGQEAGKLGKSEEQLTVSYDTIEENQSDIEEFVNGKLVPLFPEVKSWRWVMKPPAPEDMEKKAAEAIAWFNAVRVGRDAGANVKLDPQASFDWPLTIEDWEDRPEGGPAAPEAGTLEPEEPRLPPSLLERHGGPGPHDSGTPQSIHAEGDGTSGRTTISEDTLQYRVEREGDWVIKTPKPGFGIQLSVDIEFAKKLEGLVPETSLAQDDGVWVLRQRYVEGRLASEEETEEVRREIKERGVSPRGLLPQDIIVDADGRKWVVDVGNFESARKEKSLLVEKSLTTRDIPPKEAVAGIRKAEDELAAKLKKRLDKAARDFKRMAGRKPAEVELRRLTADIAAGLQEEFGRLGEQYVGRAYRLGLEEEKATTPGASFEARDRTAIRELVDNPAFLKGRLSKVVEDATGTIGDEIRTALQEGENTGAAARRAADMLGEEVWKVERIVRSETTRVANRGRFEQFKKHGRPKDTYSWITARDARVDADCRDLEAASPWKLQELIDSSNDGLPHPNCRCTVRRHVALT